LWAYINGQAVSIAWQTAGGLASLFAAVLGSEILAANSKTARYVQKPFRTDLFYTVLIVGGVYGSIQQPIITWVDSAVRHHASFLYLSVLRNFPTWLGLVIFLVTVDFCRYWKHRWLHSVPVLQDFHSIHHAPDNLNILTAYRIHFCEYVFDGIITLVPVIVLGIPPKMWLPLYLLLFLHSAFVHSDLNLGFGWFERVFVSPRFHAVHHSADRREYETNFGALFSLWDMVFGTATFLPSQPKRYGLPGLPIPQSFYGQLLFPVILIIGRFRGKSGAKNSAPVANCAATALLDLEKN
jgi:sterol desaturase/sphingolipid hydroxylase (fatty acid hydroxylase superfamily)